MLAPTKPEKSRQRYLVTTSRRREVSECHDVMTLAKCLDVKTFESVRRRTTNRRRLQAPGKAPRRPVVPSGALTPHLALARMHPGARIAPEQRKKRTVSDLCASVEPAKAHGAPAGNQNAAKGEENKGVIYPFDSDRKGSRSPERIIARLKRDAATDTHAAALLGSIAPLSLAPSASWCPQVPPGQASPHSLLALDTQGLRGRLTGS
mgnify:CR=1 FL=1